MINFGLWIRSLRKEQQLDIRTLSERTGVEVSTISRVENARTQVTLLTAVRLCEGLGKEVADVLTVLHGNPTLKVIEEQVTGTDAVPTMSDVEQFLAYFHRSKEKTWFSDLLNKADALSKGNEGSARGTLSHVFVPEDMHKLLLDSPFYRFEIQYPPTIAANDIFTIYQHGGMLTLIDIGEYVKKVRREKQVTLAQLEQAANITQSIRSRLESTVIEQIKLADVFMLDEQLGQEGTLLSMYWSVYSFYARLFRRHAASAEQNLKLASIFILTCRWLQFMNPQDITWISAMRSNERLV